MINLEKMPGARVINTEDGSIIKTIKLNFLFQKMHKEMFMLSRTIQVIFLNEYPFTKKSIKFNRQLYNW